MSRLNLTTPSTHTHNLVVDARCHDRFAHKATEVVHRRWRVQTSYRRGALLTSVMLL